MLVYATGPLYDKLVSDYGLKKVTVDTSDEDLRKMDERDGDFYPVYIINDEYGIRGLDYRAANNVHGICMIICSSFSDMRTRIQALRRIMRYSDKGMYIQNCEVDEIDIMKQAEIKGKI